MEKAANLKEMLHFNAANETFRKLMGNGILYRVPPFQRDYSWEEDQWEDLWQDVEALFSDGKESGEHGANHYMGCLVLQSNDNKEFHVIDGQQRMTTISLLILAVLSHLQDLSNADVDADKNRRRKEQLQNSYIGYLDPVTLTTRPKLELNRHNNGYYQSYLIPLERIPQRGLKASEHLLRKSFFYFKDRVGKWCGNGEESGEKAAAFIDLLVDRLFFTVITVTDELNAFKVFETLNARGGRLSATDLLKNHLFSLVSAEAPHETETMLLERLWERIIDLLGGERLPEFLRIFWNSRNRLVRKAALFKTIRKNITNKAGAFRLLRDLDHAASVYAALRDPGDPLWKKEERDALNRLRLFQARQPLAVLMACHHRFFETDRKAFSRFLTAVVTVSLRYNVICGNQAHEQERVYNDIAVKLTQGIYSRGEEAILALRPAYPEDRRFTSAFAEKEMRTTSSRNKRIVRHLLFELERHLHGHGYDEQSAKYTLEHILPEHPSGEWPDLAEGVQDRMIHRLGNMTLLEASANRDLGNCGYAEKRRAYENSGFGITKAVAAHYDEWNEEKLNSRQERMAKAAAEIWRIAFEEPPGRCDGEDPDETLKERSRS